MGRGEERKAKSRGKEGKEAKERESRVRLDTGKRVRKGRLWKGRRARRVGGEGKGRMGVNTR